MGRKLCVLCGAEPGEAGEYLGVYSEYQLFCSGCAARYREAGEPERRELRGQIAVSPNASRGKIMQQKHAQALECISDLLCPACTRKKEGLFGFGRRKDSRPPWEK